MTIRKPFRSALLALLPLVFAVSAVAPANAQSTDARRIVAVGGAITETLYALGAQDRIVAIDTTSVFPPQVTEKPNVGYMRALSAEGVLAQSPDLILMEAGAGPPQAIELLKSLGHQDRDDAGWPWRRGDCGKARCDRRGGGQGRGGQGARRGRRGRSCASRRGIVEDRAPQAGPLHSFSGGRAADGGRLGHRRRRDDRAGRRRQRLRRREWLQDGFGGSRDRASPPTSS
ncbi:ABC transporter substrate-binding protein [Jiella pelagia]|uniref:ABC transporter substrate-binding protein n=1 Tax=Jiella pelagia TaxID=2986949 RepID=A0ABY7C3M1_9HYPH|nr:ABC transporter substrate-binding protein [Jiella pelagia]WAP70407.1 ABC transporter substrate-binding protein [Jiella pelagia]